MYSSLKATKSIVDNHIKDLSPFKFSYFLGQSSTYLSVEDVQYFMFEAKKTPESSVIYENLTKSMAGLLLIYPKRPDYRDASLVILTKNGIDIDHNEFARTAKPIIAAKFSKENLFCMRSNILTSETDQIKILEAIGFEKEVHMKEHVYYDLKYVDAFAYTLFGKNL